MASSTVVRLSCAEKAALVPCAKRGQGYIEGSVPAREVFAHHIVSYGWIDASL